MSETRRPRAATQYGPTAANVAANVRRVRELKGLSIYSLSAALEKAGRPIAPSAVAKIERQERQVTADDLTALAAVLSVNPSALLLPLDDSPESQVEITGVGVVSGTDAWDWVDGKRPIKVDPRDASTDLLTFELHARPGRRRNELQSPEKLTQATADLIKELSRDGRSGWVINPALLVEDELRRREAEGESDG